MTDYRILTIAPDGRITNSRPFVCDADEHAIDWAKHQLTSSPVELWSAERLVKRFPAIRAEGKDDAASYEVHGGRMVRKRSE
jgi:hypothetical protein